MSGDLKPCPFCGANPHRGLEKVRHCQLHGDPLQDFSFWCPRGHAKVTASTEAEAITAWNTRTDTNSDLLEALAPFAALADEMDRVGATHRMPPAEIRRAAQYAHCHAARDAISKHRALIDSDNGAQHPTHCLPEALR
ncbi:MAG: hypothetical protein EON59_03860 [Alphaproteobacteria bacterium]|nr:MAG: hypothetical protein EON59_03860 [Alphaproteobacteria bacterium]